MRKNPEGAQVLREGPSSKEAFEVALQGQERIQRAEEQSLRGGSGSSPCTAEAWRADAEVGLTRPRACVCVCVKVGSRCEVSW